MPLLDDEAPLQQQRRGLIVDDEAPQGPAAPKQITDLVRQVGQNQQAVALERGVTPGQVARLGANIFLGGGLQDVQAPPGAGAQSAEQALGTPGRVGQFAYENPRQAAALGAAMAPGVLAGLATGGASVPVQLAAQGAAGVVGEGARQYVAGEPLDWRLLLPAGALQAIPITGGPAAATVKGGLVSAADLATRTGIQEGRFPTSEELVNATVIGGGVTGGLTAALQALQRRAQAISAARTVMRQDAADVAGGTPMDPGAFGNLPPSQAPAGMRFPQAGQIIDDELAGGAPPPIPNLAPRPPAPPAQTVPIAGAGAPTAAQVAGGVGAPLPDAPPRIPPGVLADVNAAQQRPGLIVDDEGGPLAGAQAGGPIPQGPAPPAPSGAPPASAGPSIAVRTADGRVFTSPGAAMHSEVLAAHNLDPGTVADTGFVNEAGEYRALKQPGLAQPAEGDVFTQPGRNEMAEALGLTQPQPGVTRSPADLAASPEAMNRIRSEQAQGTTYERIDIRSGQREVVPAITDRVDIQPQRHQVIVIRRPNQPPEIRMGPNVTPDAWSRFQARSAAAAPPPAGPARLSAVIANQADGPPPPPTVIQDANVYRVPIGDIDTDPATFQPRRNYGKGGSTGRLATVDVYKDESAGNLVVWRNPQTGRLVVVDGHNRLERFGELGVPDVRVIELRVATALEARVEGALINIRQGSFDAVDVGNVLRDTGLTIEQLRAAGLPMNARELQDGLALANLHPALFGMAARGEMPMSRAVAIGRGLAGGPQEQAQQMALVKMLSGRKADLSDKEVIELINQTKLAPTVTETTKDLFGEAEIAKSLVVERSQVVSGVREELVKDKALFGYVSKAERAARLKEEGAELSPERAKEIAQQSGDLAQTFTALANRQGPVADAVSDAAREIAQGARPAAAIDRALPAIRAAVAAELAASRGRGGALAAAAEGAEGSTGSLFNKARQKLGDERGSIGVVPPRLSDFLKRGSKYVQELRAEGRKLEQEAIEAELSAARRRPFPGAVGQRGLGPGVQTAPGTDRSQPATMGAMSSRDKLSFSPSIIRNEIDGVLNRVGGINRDDIEWARRGVVPLKLTQMRADEIAGEWAKRIGADPDTVARMREKGQVPNAEEMLAMLHLSDRFGARAIRTAARAEQTGTLSDTLQAVTDAATASNMFVQAQAGASEIGRALNILRQAAYGPGGRGAQNAAIRKAVKYFGGTDNLEDIVKRIRMFRPEEVDQLNRYMATVTPKRWGDKLLAGYYFALLGNIPGRVVDLLSTGAFSLRRVGERLGAAGADAALSAARGTPRTRFAADAGADLLGHYMGVRQGVRSALRTLITQQPSSGFSRFREVESAVRPFKTELLNTITGVPRSVIEATDEFNKAMTASGFLYGEASRIARTEGRTGQDLIERMAEIIEDPRMIDGLWEQIRAERQYRTFQDPLGPRMQKLLEVINAEVPDNQYAPILAGLRPLRFVMPFFRTTVKLQKLGVRDAFGMPLLLAQLASGRLPKDQGALADELARTAIGTSIAAAAMAYAAEGYLTGGGPLDPQEAELLRSTGWAPNSINFGGKDQYEYRRFEPFGTTMGIAADLYDGWPVLEEEDSAGRFSKYVSEALTTTGSGLLKQAINAPYVKGLSDLYDAMDDPKRYGQSFVNNQVAAFIPGIVRQTAIASDPTIRRPRTLAQTLQARIPGLTEGSERWNLPPVPPLVDVWGRDVVRKGGFWEILTSPINRRELFDDPASRAIRELRWKPGSPRRELGFAGERLELSDATYEKYVKTVGAIAFRMVTDAVTRPEWQPMPDKLKRQRLSAIWMTARRIGKAEVMPDLVRMRGEVDAQQQRGGR